MSRRGVLDCAHFGSSWPLGEVEREQLAQEAHAVAERRSALDTELAAVPGDDALRHAHAHAHVSIAADTAPRARVRHGERAVEAARAAEESHDAAGELAESARDMNLPTDRAGLGSVRQSLADHAALLAALWPALREQEEAEHAVTSERTEVDRASQRLSELTERTVEAARLAASTDERLATLNSTVGVAVAELQRLLAETTSAQRVCEEEQRRPRRTSATGTGEPATPRDVASGSRRTSSKRPPPENARSPPSSDSPPPASSPSPSSRPSSLRGMTGGGQRPPPSISRAPLRHSSPPSTTPTRHRSVYKKAPQRGVRPPPGRSVSARPHCHGLAERGRHARRHRLPGPGTWHA